MELTIPKKILVVDDEPKARTMYQRELEDRGYKVLVAANGHEGLARLTEHKLVDAIILDLRMPDMNGADFLRQLAREGKQIPVIVCTAFSGAADPFEFQDLGVRHIFTKPVDLEKLADKVREIVPEKKTI